MMKVWLVMWSNDDGGDVISAHASEVSAETMRCECVVSPEFKHLDIEIVEMEVRP